MRHLTIQRATLVAATLLAMAMLTACSSGSTGDSPAPSATISPSASAAATVAPSVEPSTEPSAAPSAEPSVDPSMEPTGATFDVPLTIATPHAVSAEVVDWTGLVTAATSGTPGDGASVPFDAVEIANDGPTTLLVTWAGGPCDQQVSLVVDAGRALVTVIQEPCEGDAVAFDRIVRLELSEPLDATTVTGVLQPGGDTPG